VAIRRRGVPPQAILEFVAELGVTTSDSVIRNNRFDNVVRRYLERKVPRVWLVLDPVKIILDDLPENSKEFVVPYDPKAPSGKSRTVRVSKEVYIDRNDFREVDSPDFFRLAPGKVVGLLNAFPIKAESFEKDSATGKVTVIHATKAEGKPKAFIHWVGSDGVNVVARQFNALFNDEDPNGLDWKTGGYADSLNPNSEVVWPNALVERSFVDLVKEAETSKNEEGSDGKLRFQAVRTGYFAVDPEKKDGKTVLNQIVSLKEDSGKGT
jgi:glutaminyl-tRNA synthetase